MKVMVLVLIMGLIALVAIFPASATGQNDNGKMFKTGTAPQDGTGFKNGGNQNGQMNGNGTCIHENCPNNGTPLLNGTGLQYGNDQGL